MIAIENLKTILFFSFKIDQHSRIASLFFLLSTPKFFKPCIFLNVYLFFVTPNSSSHVVFKNLKKFTYICR
jgi:hypothetical protein